MQNNLKFIVFSLVMGLACSCTHQTISSRLPAENRKELLVTLDNAGKKKFIELSSKFEFNNEPRNIVQWNDGENFVSAGTRSPQDPMISFVQSAKTILTYRTKVQPKVARYLPGWNARLNQY